MADSPYFETTVPGLYVNPKQIDEQSRVLIFRGPDEAPTLVWDSIGNDSLNPASPALELSRTNIPGVSFLGLRLVAPESLRIVWKSSTTSGLPNTLRLPTSTEARLLEHPEALPIDQTELGDLMRSIHLHQEEEGVEERKDDEEEEEEREGEEEEEELEEHFGAQVRDLTSSATQDLSIMTRRHRNGTWQLMVKDNEVLYMRERIKNTLDPQKFAFDKNSRVGIYRFKEGWAIKFDKCGCVAKIAIDGNVAGNKERKSSFETRFYALYPETKSFRHQEYSNRPPNVTQLVRERQEDSKVYPAWSASTAEGNKKSWAKFLEELKIVVENAGGTWVETTQYTPPF